MNETTKRNFFEIMEIAQKYHNANMTGNEINEQETDADALRVIRLCAEIRRDNGDTGDWAVNESLDARHALTQDIADAVIEQIVTEYPGAQHLMLDYSNIECNLSDEFDKYAREYASTAI